jgi:anti-sigma B factor antagonist
LDEGIQVITVRGELDLNTAPELEEPLEETLADAGAAAVVIDLSSCEFIDSSGLALIIQAWRELESEAGAGLALCCASDQVERMLRITGAYEAISIYDSLDDALAGLR